MKRREAKDHDCRCVESQVRHAVFFREEACPGEERVYLPQGLGETGALYDLRGALGDLPCSHGVTEDDNPQGQWVIGLPCIIAQSPNGPK